MTSVAKSEDGDGWCSVSLLWTSFFFICLPPPIATFITEGAQQPTAPREECSHFYFSWTVSSWQPCDTDDGKRTRIQVPKYRNLVNFICLFFIRCTPFLSLKSHLENAYLHFGIRRRVSWFLSLVFPVKNCPLPRDFSCREKYFECATVTDTLNSVRFFFLSFDVGSHVTDLSCGSRPLDLCALWRECAQLVLTGLFFFYFSRTAAGPGEIVLSGDGNYAASANGQCLLHVRSRLHQSGSSSSSANGMVINKKSLHSNCARPADDVVKRTRSMNV